MTDAAGDKTDTTDSPSTVKDMEYIDTQLILMSSNIYPSNETPENIKEKERARVALCPAARAIVAGMTPTHKAQALALRINHLTAVIAQLMECDRELRKPGRQGWLDRPTLPIYKKWARGPQ